MDLHNFIEDYICQEDPNIQWDIACRKEFNELTSDKIKLEKIDRYFKHQQLFLRYLRQYDRIFNIQATGTGKSGSIINAAEYFKKNGGNIKRIYVIQPGLATKKDFENQIQKLSDPDEYLNDKIKYSSSKKSYKNNITRLIKEWYSIETYRAFVKKDYDDETIIKEFSDCLIFFDEAHSLKNLTDDKGKTLSKEERQKVYDFLWRVTHLAQRSKIVVATATPLVKKVSDFVSLLNLLLPADFQLPKLNNFYNKLTLNQLEPFFRGKITFIKFSENNINILNKGKQMDYVHKIEVPKKDVSDNIIKPTVKKVENNKVIIVKEPKQIMNEVKFIKVPSQIKLTNLEINENQLKVYLEIINKKGANTSFFQKELQSLLFVYPDGSLGKKGFDRYTYKNNLHEYEFRTVINNSYAGIYDKYISENDLEKSLENIKMMSSKFYFYIKKELLASEKEKPGNSFCYIAYNEASGAILLGMFLKIFGINEYKSNFSPRDLRTKKITIEKKKRFFILNAEAKNIQETLNFFNSEENKHGQYIQMIIATKMAQVGINVKNVLRGYIMTPGWHEAGMYQALSRFIRADSHDMLFKETNEKSDVEIYRLNSVLPKEYGISIDTKLYLDSEEEDIIFKRYLRYMKQTSFDAFLNYDRNINLPPSTKDFSVSADYDKIKYKIFSSHGDPGNKIRTGMALNQGPNPGDYKYTTYNLFYSCGLINKVKTEIKKIIMNEKIITVQDLKNLITGEVSNYVYNSALEELIFDNENIPNLQNTVQYNLKRNSNLLYLKRESIISNDKFSNEDGLFYDNNFPVIERSLILEENDIENFYKIYGNLEEEQILNFYIQKQNYLLFQGLLEDSLLRLRNGTMEEINKIIIKLFSNYILIIDEPIGLIDIAIELLETNRKVKQGRKRSEYSTVALKDLDLDKIKNYKKGNKIYAHFYKDIGQSFSVNTIFTNNDRTVRILKKEENNFIETDISENFVYKYFFDKMYKKIFEPFDKSKYYGMIIYRGLQGGLEEKEKQFLKIIDNTASSSRGKNCYHYGIETLIDAFKYIDDKGKFKHLFERKIKKTKLCPLLVKLFKQKKLLFTSM